MSGIATAIVGSAVIGGVMSSKAAGSAADAQVRASDNASATQLQAARESNELQLKMFDQNRADQEPWRQAGITALGQLGTGTKDGGDFNRDFTLADFTKDPGYDFRMQQGQRGLDASAAARGGALGGAAIKAATRYGQDYASGEYSNAYNRFNADRTARFNRLSSLAGVGQTATNQVGAQGAQTAANIGNTQVATGNAIASNQIGAGNAQASSYIGQGNAMGGMANTLGNFAMSKYYMNNMPQFGGGASSYGGGAGVQGGWGSTGAEMPIYG